jgi:hypothetical protein
MVTSMNRHTTSMADTLAEQPEDVVAAVCAPSHHAALTGAEVVEVAELLGIDFAAAPFSVEDLQRGIELELELGNECSSSMVDAIDDDLVEVGKSTVSMLQEQADYYIQLTQPHAPGDPTLLRHVHADIGGD